MIPGSAAGLLNISPHSRAKEKPVPSKTNKALNIIIKFIKPQIFASLQYSLCSNEKYK